MTTLAELRTFAAEIASADVASLAGDREINYWINAAFARVWLEHSWNHTEKKGRLTFDLEEPGVDMTLVQGSGAIQVGQNATGETLDEKYLPVDELIPVREGWELYVTGEGRMTFTLESIDDSPTNENGTLETGHIWTRASELQVGYVFARHVYPLPDDAQRVDRVEYLQQRVLIDYIRPDQFDHQRQSTPTQRGNDPLFWTTRRGNIEFWPGPGTELKSIELSYKRKAPTHLTTDLGTIVVDWPTEWITLLFKAIVVEASVTQGENAVVPLQIALGDYGELLKAYKAEDSMLGDGGGPISLGGRSRALDYTRITNYPAIIPEV